MASGCLRAATKRHSILGHAARRCQLSRTKRVRIAPVREAAHQVAAGLAVFFGLAFVVLFAVVVAGLMFIGLPQVRLPPHSAPGRTGRMPAFRRELRLLGNHAGRDAIDVGYFGAAKTERIGLAGLLLFLGIGMTAFGNSENDSATASVAPSRKFRNNDMDPPRVSGVNSG